MDIQEYLERMAEVKDLAGTAIRTAQKRLAMKAEMQAISDKQEDPSIAMDAAQKAALVAGQLALTETVDAPLAAAKAALE